MPNKQLSRRNNRVGVVLISKFHFNIIERVEYPRLGSLVQYSVSILKAALFKLDVLSKNLTLFREQVEF